MDASRLKKCRQQLSSRLPLIGGWLQTQAVKNLIADGSAEAVRLLEEAAGESAEATVRDAALDSLGKLAAAKNVAAQEALCRLVIYHDDPAANEVVSTRGYVPHNESHRAVFYFLTERWHEYEALDFDHHLLREAFDAADEALRSRIAAKAREAGRLEWVDIVSGGKQCRRLALMSDEDWRSALSVLEAKGRWEELWRLAQEAPPRWSAQILPRLRKARWRPQEEDVAGFDELVKLARSWKQADYTDLICHRTTLTGHQHEVRCLAIAPSGHILASGSADNTVRLWSLPEGEPLKTLARHTGWINCLAIPAPHGRVLASAGRDGRICLWSLPGGKALARLRGHTQPIYCLAFTPGGGILASGSSDATIRLWSVVQKRLLETLEGHEGGVACLAVSPDGAYLASGSADSTVRLWRLPEGKLLQTLEGHRNVDLDGVLSLAFSPDGRVLASGGTDGRVLLWSAPSGRLKCTLKGHIGPITALVVTPDGKWLASGSTDQAIGLWRMPSGKAVKMLGGLTGENSCLVLSADGNLLACSSGGGLGTNHTVRLWRMPQGKALATLEGHSRYIACLAMSAHGRLLASGSGDGTIRLWSAELERLTHLPAAQASLKDLDWVQRAARDGRLHAKTKPALAFIEALLRRRRRLDIFVDDALPHVIEVGEFDIEIVG